VSGPKHKRPRQPVWFAPLLLVGLIGLFATGCGSSGHKTSPTTAGQTGAVSGGANAASPNVNPNGILRFGYDLTAATKGGFSWDPTVSKSVASDIGLYHMVYGGLFRLDPTGKEVPDLAQSATLVDQTTIDVVLRDNITYPDGTKLTPDLVKQQLDKNISRRIPAFSDQFYSLKSVDIVPPKTVRLHIPDGTAAQWYESFLASQETLIIPPNTNFSMPTGAGPFMITSYVPGQTIVMKKNPQYWNAQSIRLAGVDVVNMVSNSPAAIGALDAGQVDFAYIDYSQIPALSSNEKAQLTTNLQGLMYFQMCKSAAPFNNPKVRLALSRAIDRQAIDDALYNGKTSIAYGVWPPDNPLYDPGLAQGHDYNPQAAKQLLAEAGYPNGLTFDVMLLAPFLAPPLEIVQQEWKQIGVTANIKTTSSYVQDFLINHKANIGFISGISVRPRLNEWTSTAIDNPCGYTGLNADAAKLQTLSSNSPQAEALWKTVQQTMADEALGLFILWVPRVDAYNINKVVNVSTVYPVIPVPDVWDAYIKA
jgi:peptide/nickel transport system substrate-binding protein